MAVATSTEPSSNRFCLSAIPTSSTPGSPPRCGRSRRWAGRRRRQELKRFYPTSVLVTGFDIIFFWVARMMMMGLHFMKEIPFHDVYIHALVRDEKGQKMSKTKGNVMDPLEHDRPVRRRRAALHAGRHGRPGPRHQAVDQPRRGLSQLRHQAVERGALRRDERMRAQRRLRSQAHRGDRQPLDRRRAGARERRPSRPASRPTSSTRPPAPSTSSSGARSATGTWS